MIDPITLAVVRGALQEISNEMDAAFYTTAFSPIIAEGKDIASGLYHPESGEVIAQGEQSLPLFVTVMQHTVQHVLAATRGRRELLPGDVYIVNNPYQGGTHLMDVKMVAPYFVNGKLFALLANTGHWPDIGGAVPGGFNTSATEIYQEGLNITPVRLYRRGKLDEELLDFILQNVRVPDARVGDIHAQVGALHVGAKRLDELVKQFEPSVLTTCIDEIFLRSEAIMRGHLKEIPEGIYRYTEHIDSDGINPDPLTIDLAMTVKSDAITLDFSGSSPPCSGPLNSVWSSTVSACHVALKHIFLDVPINAGAFRPIDIIAPHTTFLNALPPKPTSGCTAEVSQRIIDTIFGALAQAVPDMVTAGSFSTTNNLTIGGNDDVVGPYVLYLYFGGGYGASTLGDGISNGCSLHSTARMTPMEVYEQRYPYKVHHFRLHNASGGRGRYRGGFGIDIAMELLRGEAVMALLGDRGRFAPRGLLGGADAIGTKITIHRKNGDIFIPQHLTKGDHIRLYAGDILRVCTPGGAGYGPEAERDPAYVEADIRANYYGPTEDLAFNSTK